MRQKIGNLAKTGQLIVVSWVRYRKW